MSKNPIVITLLLTLSILTLSSCDKTGQKDHSRKDILFISSPVRITGFFDPIIDDLVISPLFLTDYRNNVHNILIEEVGHSDDGTVWSIKIKGDAVFHDGGRLTADDVAASILRKKEMDRGADDRLENIKGVVAEDKKTVRIELNSPVDDIHYLLMKVYVYPKNNFNTGAQRQDNYIGSGPFKFGRWSNNGLELIANDNYFDGKSRIDRIVYISEVDERKRLYQFLKGDVDLLPTISPEAANSLEKDRRFHVNKFYARYFTALFFNTKSPIFSDKRLRRAINRAINKIDLVEKGLKGAGVPASGPFLPNSWASYPKIAPNIYNPKEALRDINEAGWTYDNDNGILRKRGKEFRFKVLYIKEMEELRKAADTLQRYLYEIGIVMEPVPVRHEEVTGRLLGNRDYDAILCPLNGGIDPSTTSKVWRSDGKYNLSAYSNGEVDRLFEEDKNTGNFEERIAIYHRIHRILHDDAPAVFLYHPLWFTAVNKRFKGAEEFMGDPYSWYKIKDWSPDEDFGKN